MMFLKWTRNPVKQKQAVPELKHGIGPTTECWQKLHFQDASVSVLISGPIVSWSLDLNLGLISDYML